MSASWVKPADGTILPLTKKQEEFRQQTLEMHKVYIDQNISLGEAAKLFNYKRASLSRRFKKEKLEIRPGELFYKRKQIPVEEIYKRYSEEGIPLAKLAKLYKVSQATIKKYFTKENRALIAKNSKDKKEEVLPTRENAPKDPIFNHKARQCNLCPKEISPGYILCKDHWVLVPAVLKSEFYKMLSMQGRAKVKVYGKEDKISVAVEPAAFIDLANKCIEGARNAKVPPPEPCPICGVLMYYGNVLCEKHWKMVPYTLQKKYRMIASLRPMWKEIPENYKLVVAECIAASNSFENRFAIAGAAK